MKTSCSFTKNNLKSFFRPGWKGMGDPGVEEVETRIFVKPGRGCGADKTRNEYKRGVLDLRETGTGMWSCLSALFEEILCTVSD